MVFTGGILLHYAALTLVIIKPTQGVIISLLSNGTDHQVYEMD